MNPLTPDQINIELCKWRGWKHKLCNEGVDAFYLWIDPSGGAVEEARLLPSHTTDLNVMHEAEKALSEDQWEQYVFWLAHICELGRYTSATALQRATALLRVVNPSLFE